MAAPNDPLVDPILIALVEIVRTFMGLDNDQVVIYNSNWRIPPDNRLYVTISFLASRPIGTSVEYVDRLATEDAPAALIERVTVQNQETYTLNAFSSTLEARLRNWEIAAALASTLAQQIMERVGFCLAKMPIGVADVSALEGAARLTRMANTIPLIRSNTRESVVSYFDNFIGSPDIVINP